MNQKLFIISLDKTKFIDNNADDTRWLFYIYCIYNNNLTI